MSTAESFSKGSKGSRRQHQLNHDDREDDKEEVHLLKSVQKQMSLGANSSSDANFLLGFTYNDDDQYQ